LTDTFAELKFGLSTDLSQKVVISLSESLRLKFRSKYILRLSRTNWLESVELHVQS